VCLAQKDCRLNPAITDALTLSIQKGNEGIGELKIAAATQPMHRFSITGLLDIQIGEEASLAALIKGAVTEANH